MTVREEKQLLHTGPPDKGRYSRCLQWEEAQGFDCSAWPHKVQIRYVSDWIDTSKPYHREARK